MNKRFESFYGKVLLYGEYSVILNSMGLTIPFTHFSGELSFIDDDKYTDINFARHSNRELRSFVDYLSKNQETGELASRFDLEELNNDLEKGLYFESTIPQGYGLGSSGALVAALYHDYGMDILPAADTLTMEEILILKNSFAEIEGFFHGRSSGLDPLNCYLGRPLLIRENETIEMVHIPLTSKRGGGAIFLIDTGIQGRTAPLVEYFMKKLEEKDFTSLVQNEMIPLNNICIEATIAGNTDDMFLNLVKLSDFQLNYFKHMIPGDFIKVWKEALEEDVFIPKLLGSGGGGYMLGFTSNYNKAKTWMARRGLTHLPVYKDF